MIGHASYDEVIDVSINEINNARESKGLWKDLIMNISNKHIHSYYIHSLVCFDVNSLLYT